MQSGWLIQVVIGHCESFLVRHKLQKGLLEKQQQQSNVDTNIYL